MPRRGWSTVQVPDGWLQQSSGSQVASPQGVRGPPPGEVVSNARARVTKIGGSSGRIGRIRPEALKKAKALTHVRPVDERIASIDRAKKRIGSCREEVVRAKEVLAQAQAKLQSEEQSLVEGEARLAAFVAGVRGVEGGSSSHLASHHFCPRVGGVASMCVTVTTREFRSSKRSQTGQESATFDPRFGPLNQPGQACQRTGSTHWHVDWRFDQPCARAEVRRAIPDQLLISWTLLQTIPWGFSVHWSST